MTKKNTFGALLIMLSSLFYFVLANRSTSAFAKCCTFEGEVMDFTLVKVTGICLFVVGLGLIIYSLIYDKNKVIIYQKKYFLCLVWTVAGFYWMFFGPSGETSELIKWIITGRFLIIGSFSLLFFIPAVLAFKSIKDKSLNLFDLLVCSIIVGIFFFSMAARMHYIELILVGLILIVLGIIAQVISIKWNNDKYEFNFNQIIFLSIVFICFIMTCLPYAIYFGF